MAGFFGHSDAVELEPIRVWDPRLGYSLERRWKGRPTTVDIIEGQLRDAGIRYRRQENSPGGYDIITGIYGAEETQPPDQPLADLWDLLANDVQKSLWTAPLVVGEMNKLFSVDAGVINETKLAYMARLRADVEALARGEVVTFAPTTGEQSGFPLTVSNLIQTIVAYNASLSLTLSGLALTAAQLDLEFWKSLIYSFSIGDDTFVRSEWVLRRRTVIAKNSTIKPSTSNIDRQYTTTAALVALEGVPGDLPFDLPEGRWLKKGPQRQQVAADKWEITQEYLHSDWWNPIAYQVAS